MRAKKPHAILHDSCNRQGRKSVLLPCRFVRAVSKLGAFGDDGHKCAMPLAGMVSQLPIAHSLLRMPFSNLLLRHVQCDAIANVNAFTCIWLTFGAISLCPVKGDELYGLAKVDGYYTRFGDSLFLTLEGSLEIVAKSRGPSQGDVGHRFLCAMVRPARAFASPVNSVSRIPILTR